MKVFLTGATGFVGQEILPRLQQEQHSVRILARKPGSRRVRRLQEKHEAEVHFGDVTEPASLEGALIGMDAILHLVGIISQAGQSTFENVHVRGTQHLVAAAQKAGVRRFIHMSALGTRPNAASRYHQTKWAAEEILRHSGLDYTIFRPSLIFGPKDHFVNLFAAISRFSPIVPIMGSGCSRFQPVAIEAVASAFAGSVTEPRSVNRALDLCGSETLTFNQIVDTILTTLDRRRLKLHLPLGIARMQATLLEWIYPNLMNRAPPLNRDQLIMLEEGNTGAGWEANELFRLPEIRFRNGIAKYLRH